MGNKTYVKMKKLFWLLIPIFVSCENPFKIEHGDTIKYCVIDTMFITESPSTIEPGRIYHYGTNCDKITITTRRNDVYEIGDTITYVYKKR